MAKEYTEPVVGYPGVLTVRWDRFTPGSDWFSVEVIREHAALDMALGVSGVNEVGEVCTSFIELAPNETTVHLRMLRGEQIYGLAVDGPEYQDRDDAALYYHALRLFRGVDTLPCPRGYCEHILPLGNSWWWPRAIESLVRQETEEL